MEQLEIMQSEGGEAAVAEPVSAGSSPGGQKKLQQMGRQLLSSMYMLMRTVKIHEPENAVFIKPIEALKDVVNGIVAREGELNLQGIESAIYLNNHLIKVDPNSLETIRYVISEFKARNLGGFQVERPVTVEELRNFVNLFSRDWVPGTEEAGAGDSVASIKMSKFQTLKEFMQEEGSADSEISGIDRRRYALVAYARAVYFLRSYLKHVKGEGQPVNPGHAGRLMNDLVEVCFQHNTNFLGLTTVKSLDEYTCYHSVNTAMLNIVFGQGLGMGKEQLSDLALTGYFHDLGRTLVSPELLSKPGPLTAAERKEVERIPLHTIKVMMRQRTMDRPLAERIIAVYEHRIEYQKSVRDPGTLDFSGRAPQRSVMNLFGRILEITHTFDGLTSPRPWRESLSPQKALGWMAGDMKRKFDPFLLRSFIQIMACVPVREVEGDSISLNVT